MAAVFLYVRHKWRRWTSGEAKFEKEFEEALKRAEETGDGGTVEIDAPRFFGKRTACKMEKAAKREHGDALDAASVTVYGVASHSEFVDATPAEEGDILVVVDVGFEGQGPGFLLDGVALIDGENTRAEIVGGEAYQVFLNPDGTLHTKQGYRGYEFWDDYVEGSPLRVCLVYNAPANVNKIGLGYWGKVVVDRPYDVVPSDATSPPSS